MDKAQSFLVKILLGGISVLIAEFLLPGVHIDDYLTGFILATVIILINLTLKPILILLTLPLTLVTFGLFLLVINALMVLLADRFIDGFSVDGFWWGNIVCDSTQYNQFALWQSDGFRGLTGSGHQL